MAKITASEVNKLRQTTGSGMMDCKNALVEADGDFDLAIEILRKRGQKVAGKRGDREANEGLVVSVTDAAGKKGVITILTCETDFVSKNAEFNDVATKIANIALTSGSKNIDELKAQSFDGNGLTVGDKVMEMVGKIGEKIDVSAFDIIEADTVVAYNHPGNQVASLVGLNVAGHAEIGRDVAMQIAAMNPIALNKDSVDQETIDRELAIGRELAIQEGKPEAIVDKIAQGKLTKYFKDNTLLEQDFVKDGSKTVAQMLDSVQKGLTVTKFERVAIG